MPIITSGVQLTAGTIQRIAQRFKRSPRHVEYVVKGLREGAPDLIAAIQVEARQQRLAAARKVDDRR